MADPNIAVLPGEWLEFTVNVPTGPTLRNFSASATLRCPEAGRLKITLTQVGASNAAATVHIAFTGTGASFTAFASPQFSLAPGNYRMRVEFEYIKDGANLDLDFVHVAEH
jgi:hypothetical protein